MAVSAVAGDVTYDAPENPATGIWIQQIGDLIAHNGSKATLYYTKYAGQDRVKSIDYQYDGGGRLLMNPKKRETLCTGNSKEGMDHGAEGDGLIGADGIVHHPDGDLLIAAQGRFVHKVSKTAKKDGGKCLVATATPATSTSGFWHLMMDPTQEVLWGAGIPGPLFRFDTRVGINKNNFAEKGYRVHLQAAEGSRRNDDALATLIWDNEGTAFYTYSNYYGGGCEANANTGALCDEASVKSRKAGAYFAMITDTVKTLVTADNRDAVGGNIGDSVITTFRTKILIDSLEGAHGGTYDPYSKTIFVFGGSRIVQILPYRENGEMKAKVVATIDLRKMFFVETLDNMTLPRTNDGGYVGWRLDQGTVDGYGHLFVASNSGHMVFVDYTSNPQKHINDNVLIHVQWIDNYLDDLAPLTGVVVDRDAAGSGSDFEIMSSASQSSSSLQVYEESSSSSKPASSSSNKVSSSSGTIPGPGSSGSVGSSSSGSVPGSSGSVGSSSSGSVPGSSGSGDPSSSGSVPGSSGSGDPSSSGSVPGSSGSGDPSSSGSVPGSSGSGDPSSSSSVPGSSGSGDPSSSGSVPGSSGSDNPSSSGSGNPGEGSSSSGNGKSSSSNRYIGVEDFEIEELTPEESYPSPEDFERGDEIVSGTVVLVPADPDPSNPNIKVINGNNYLLGDNPTGLPHDLRYDSGKDSARVGDIVAITLDKDKVDEYFNGEDSLKIIGSGTVKVLDPVTGEKVDAIKKNTDGTITIFVTADQVVEGGSIKVVGSTSKVVIDNINFFDPVPEAHKGFIKDTNGDMDLDYLEILLKDTLTASYELENVWLVVNGDTLKCVNPSLNDAKDRIIVDVSGLDLPESEKFPVEGAVAIMSYKDKGTGSSHVRSTNVIKVGSSVIKDAYAIRDVHGKDSLFLQFNIELIPVDIGSPEMLIMLKQEAERYGFDLDQISKVYMPAKDIVILVGDSLGLKGDMKDSVSLHPNATFSELPYITSDEYDREIPVTVVDRFPAVQNVEYWDTDGDGVLDQIVSVFDSKLAREDIDGALYMSYPWYSYRGMMIQLQAQPADLEIDPNDSTRVIWKVRSTTRLAEGVTSISEKLPEANVYTYYSIFGETFVSEETAPLVDKMSPVIARATLDYGKKADTLVIVFTEPIMTKDLKGDDFFSFIHGSEVIELNPTRIDWSSDGLSAKLILDGSIATILPGDSLLVRKGDKDAIRDNYGNIAGENPQSVVIGGLLNHLVEATNMGTFDASDDRVVDEGDKESHTLQTVSSVNLRYVPGSTTKEDMEKEGALGQLVQLGERFVPQLLDRAQISADGSYDPSALDSLKPEDVFISFIVNYTDHLGQYVNDTVITVQCNSPKFGGNCLETDKKVFVNWNYKDHRGRFVGTGVYNVQFKMIVRYDKKKIEEEIKDKWGVRRKKRSKK
ncbi:MULTISPECIES: hypothetical protein [unclassified Fibrobacter]|uniref:hypothetical protein n=1 Tax=unclassified Fibrobacter TaxID=2634177 RepID=UPI0011B28A39|nr:MULTISPECIES: hypothetical protein [unclassified Fibrobacter]